VNKAIAGEIIYAIMSGCQTFSELERSTNLSPSTLSKYLAIMVERGLLKRGESENKNAFSIANRGEARGCLLHFVEKKLQHVKKASDILIAIKNLDERLWKNILVKFGENLILKLV